MSDLKSLLGPKSVVLNANVSCRREALSLLAKHCADITGLEVEKIQYTLAEREKLGSTGIGNGIAIPHGKMDGLEKMTGLLLRLDKPIEYDAVDDRPVDLFFALLAPEEANAAHLKALSKVARLMRGADVRKALRGAHSAEALYAIVVDQGKQQAA